MMEMLQQAVFYFLGLYGLLTLIEDIEDIVRKRRERHSVTSHQHQDGTP